MDERIFQTRCASLLEAMAQLPESVRASLGRQLAADEETHQDGAGAFAGQMHAMRLGLTYLVFDLEATRRENRYLRRLIDAQARSQAEDDDDM